MRRRRMGRRTGAPTANDLQRYRQNAGSEKHAAADAGTLIPWHSGQIDATTRATSTPGATGMGGADAPAPHATLT
jgi:predicted nucleic acid-binding Zn ribbon protein